MHNREVLLKRRDVRKLSLGVYMLFWKSGGASIATVGVTEDGGRWLAPLNWVTPSTDPTAWKMVKRVMQMKAFI